MSVSTLKLQVQELKWMNHYSYQMKEVRGSGNIARIGEIRNA